MGIAGVLSSSVNGRNILQKDWGLHETFIKGMERVFLERLNKQLHLNSGVTSTSGRFSDKSRVKVN